MSTLVHAAEAPWEIALRTNRKPGALWAVLQFPLTRILIAVIATTSVVALVQVGAHGIGVAPHSAAGIGLACVMMLATVAVYALFVRCIERRRVAELSLRGAPIELAAGLALGAILFSTTMLILWLGGQVDVEIAAGVSALAYPLLDALIAAVTEEVLMRGVLFRIVEESLGSWIALIFSAALFGLMHAFNPGATAVSSVAIALEAGVLLAAVFMLTRRLWMVIGLHAAWNFTEGGVFGASVSGGKAQGMLASHFHGGDLMTGGAFGPEASVVAVVVCLSAAAVVLWLAIKNGRIARPFWNRGTRAS